MKSKYKCFGNRAILNSDYALSCVNSAVFVVRVIRNGKRVSWWVFLCGLFLNWISSLIWFTVHTNTSVGTAQRAMQGWAQTSRQRDYLFYNNILRYIMAQRIPHMKKSVYCNIFLAEGEVHDAVFFLLRPLIVSPPSIGQKKTCRDLMSSPPLCQLDFNRLIDAHYYLFITHFLEDQANSPIYTYIQRYFLWYENKTF